ncbi:DUF1648 domain-containing protein [Tomitella biformata]|uniref:DUF1648 domain-containing protein n=1 Tax=Tomitella biformata TaxID=630403 RepID=UPI000464C5B1|nr:DUF1648 domain-containing protein [Tomitella biformata]
MSSVKRIDPVGAVFAFGIPLVAAAVTIALTAMWQDRLPTQIGTHWSSGPEPDGFSGVWSNTWFMVAMIIVIGGGCSTIAAFASVQLMLRRIMLVVGLTVTGLMFTVNTAMMASQLDLQDSADARLNTGSIGLGVLIGVFVGLLGARALLDLRPRVQATARPDANLPRAASPQLPIEFNLGVRPVWLWLVCGLSAAGTVITCIAVGSLWPLPLFAPVPLLMFATARYHVEADKDGVRVRSLGAAMLSYELSEIEGARVVAVHPFRDFGGWGMRFKGQGRYGVVTEKGPAAQISMAGGDVLTITTARAEELAGALNTLADQR